MSGWLSAAIAAGCDRIWAVRLRDVVIEAPLAGPAPKGGTLTLIKCGS